MKNKYWVVYINEDDSDWVNVTFPDIPGLKSCGVGIDDARKMAKEALEYAISLDFNNCKSIGSDKTNDSISEEPSDNTESGNDTSGKKTDISDKAIVCIDASHGGSDTGQDDGKNYEKTQVLELAGLVEKNLADYGVKVIMTRTTDENVDYTSRIKKINTGKAVATVSLHRDVAKKDGTGRGVSAWIYTSSPTDSKSLASDIMNVFKESGETVGGVNTGTPNDSSKNYYINQHSSSASCIIELGNMYNSDDNKLVTTNKEKTAKAISDGIIKYLEQAGYING